MTHAPQIRIPATYMRGGTSKGVFFRLQDLPEAAQVPGAARDALLLRVIGSPDPYGKQIDGMGGATSSTSKTVIVAKSSKPDHDVDYLFGQVSIDKRVRRLERQLRQSVGRRGPVRDQRAAWSMPSRIPRRRRGDRAHLAGQHRQDDHRARADDRTAPCRKPATSNSTA